MNPCVISVSVQKDLKYQFSYQIYQLLATDLIIAKTSCLAAIITVNNCCYSTVDVKKKC